jgi:hypothetical protein
MKTKRISKRRSGLGEKTYQHTRSISTKATHIQRYFSIPCCRSKSCKSIWFSHKEKRSNNKIELRARRN